MIIKDETCLDRFRFAKRCEWCQRRGEVDPHHLWCRGMGGGGRLDIPINLISLCRSCHDETHAGRITRIDLLLIVAKREHTDQDTIKDTIRDLRRKGKA